MQQYYHIHITYLFIMQGYYHIHITYLFIMHRCGYIYITYLFIVDIIECYIWHVLQTLEAAYKANGISRRYLYTWLRETFTELGKLEQDAAPEGWQCQWDRYGRTHFYTIIQIPQTPYPVHVIF